MLDRLAIGPLHIYLHDFGAHDVFMEVHAFDAGHLMLETHAAPAGSLMLDFIGRTERTS